MNDKIQMTEEQAREILDECACTETCDFKIDETISVMKQKGYIIKSKLQQKVEEAEEMYGKWESCIKGFLDKDLGEYKIIEGFYNVIQLLKQSHPEFKK